MKMIEDLKVSCYLCDASGIITEELSGRIEPWLHREIDLTCDKCEGKGYYIDKDELPYRINDIEEMIDGMETKIQVLSKSAYLFKKGLEHDLSDKYLNRIDSCTRGLYRLRQLRKKLITLAE